MKKIFIIALLLLPLGVFAKEDWKLKEGKNLLSIEGGCVSSNVKIELYPAGKGESVYSSGAVCGDGKFEFSDNLLQWKNLNNGEYEVVVDSDTENIKNIKIERPVQESSNHSSIQTSDSGVVKKEMPVSAENKFLGAFVTLQQTILDMRGWLAETKYPSFLKTGINLALNGVDLAIGEVSDLVLSGESGDVEPVENVTETQITADEPAIPAEVQQETDATQDSVSTVDSPSVSERSISEIAQ